MKFISSMLKFFAYILMILFIIFMPLAMLSRSIGQSLYDPTTILNTVRERTLNADVLADFVEEWIQNNQAIQEAEGDNLFANVMVNGLNSLDHDDWVEIIDLIAPPEVISHSFDQALDGYQRWIDGRNDLLLIQIDLREWKNSIVQNTIPVLEIILKNMPACSPNEIQRYNIVRLSGAYQDLPPCRPPEPNYSWTLETGARESPEFMRSLPNQIDNAQAISRIQRTPGEFKQRFLRSVAIMRGGWIVLFAIFVIAVPMGARSVSDILKWAGWPLLLAGLWGILISVLLKASTGFLIVNLGRLAGPELPETVLEQVNLMAAPLIQIFQRPLMFQSIVMFVIGGILLVISIVLIRKRRSKEDIIVQSSEVTEPDQKGEGEEDSPSGMFG